MIAPDKDYSPEEEASRFNAACDLAEKAALRLIARAEQSCLRLSVKLERKGHKSAVVKEVISRLLDRDLLNDERYARLWIRSRLSQGKSPFWLRVSLEKRGIDRNSAEKALKTILDPETEYALLLSYIEKTSISTADKLARARLKSEAFSSSVLDRYYFF